MDKDGDEMQVILNSKSPDFLIVTGLHGNESDVTEPLYEVLIDSTNEFEYAFIPNVNVRAVSRNVRDIEGQNFNRDFIVDSESEIARVELLKQMLIEFPSIKYILTYHEDLSNDSAFYFYDIARSRLSEDDESYSNQIDELYSKIQNMLISYPQLGGVFTGWDDENDENLQNYVIDGHIKQYSDEDLDGTFENYSAMLGLQGRNGIVRSFAMEVPGHLELKNKKLLISLIHNYFVLPFNNLMKEESKYN